MPNLDALTDEDKAYLNGRRPGAPVTPDARARRVLLGDRIDEHETRLTAVEAQATSTESAVTTINEAVSAAAYAADGLLAKRVARATINAAAGLGIGAHGLGVSLPDNAVIQRAFLDIDTTFTSATDAGTAAIKAEGANDIVNAIAISDVSNPWDAGRHDCIQDGAAANMVKTTAARELTVTVAVEALTGGHATLFVEYVVGA